MLGSFESRVAAVAADQLNDRAHLSVSAAPFTVSPPGAGEGTLRISLFEMQASSTFHRERFGLTGPGEAPQSRRVFPFECRVKFSFRVCPADDTPEETAAARRRLLQDLSLAAHRLEEAARPDQINPAGDDPGYRVLSFLLEKGSTEPEFVEGCFAGELVYFARVEIWPPGVTEQERPIRAADAVFAPLPLSIRAAAAGVAAGETTEVHVPAVAPTRLADVETGERAPALLAVQVLADVPPAERGRITSGADAAAADVRVQEITQPDTVLIYQAPDGPIDRPRLEYVAVHLATTENLPGVFLGSTPIRLLADAP